MKVCPSCKTEKPASEYGYAKARKDGLSPYCKICIREKAKAYRQRCPEKTREAVKRYYEANKKAKAEYCRQWHLDNKERASKNSARWRKVKRHLHNAKEARRRAAKNKATPLWANHDYIKLFYKAAKLEEKRTGRKVHVDHIIPLRCRDACGLHVEDNLQLLFAEDNLKKHNKRI